MARRFATSPRRPSRARLARTHPLDARVASIGHSAGGHLALWLAARPRIWKSDPLFDAAALPLAAAVSLAGVPDLARAARERVGGRAVVSLMGGSPGEVPERYTAGSPAELIPLGVRQVLLHGDRDDIVPVDLSYDYAGRAKAAGTRPCDSRARALRGHRSEERAGARGDRGADVDAARP